jgi:hypothetical protein
VWFGVDGGCPSGLLAVLVLADARTRPNAPVHATQVDLNAAVATLTDSPVNLELPLSKSGPSSESQHQGLATRKGLRGVRREGSGASTTIGTPSTDPSEERQTAPNLQPVDQAGSVAPTTVSANEVGASSDEWVPQGGAVSPQLEAPTNAPPMVPTSVDGRSSDSQSGTLDARSSDSQSGTRLPQPTISTSVSANPDGGISQKISAEQEQGAAEPAVGQAQEIEGFANAQNLREVEYLRPCCLDYSLELRLHSFAVP